jgi:outer membrane protein assembly factor BamB
MRKPVVVGIVFLFILSSTIPLVVGFDTPEVDDNGPMDSAWPMFSHDVRHTGRSSYGSTGNIGVEKWRFKTDGRVASSPAIDKDGTIYFGVNDFTNSFFALNPDGSEKWRFKTGHWVMSSPAIADDGTIYFGSNIGKLFALNPDGSEKWRLTVGDGWVFSSPVIDDDGIIYVASVNGKNICAIFPNNGTKKWNFKTDGLIYSSAALDLDKNMLYIGSHDGSMYALYKNNGTLNWKFRTDEEVKSPPSIGDDGTIYFCSWNGYTYALNPDGTEKWKFNTGDAAETSPAIAEDGTIYVGSYNGKIFSLSSDGDEIWCYKTSNWVVSSPAIDKFGTIYIGDMNHNLLALNPDGSLRWKYKTNGAVESSPAIADDGTIYFGSYEYFYAVEVKEHAPNLEITNVRSGIGYLKANVMNVGDVAANNVYWDMSILGSGIFDQQIDMETNGMINLLEPGMSVTIKIGPLFAFGPPKIEIQTRSVGANPDKWMKYCWIIGPFFLT